MTLCVGLATQRGVWIGAESGSTAEDATEVAEEPKLWRSNGWLVASAGNWRAIEIMRYDLEFPDPAGNAHRALCMGLQDALGQAFERNGFTLKTNNDGDVTEESAYWILVARDGQLWFVDYEGHVERKRRAAIGVGNQYALGLIDSSDLGAPATRIKRVLKKAAQRYRCLVGPYVVEQA